LKKSYPIIHIIGLPGSGKTTLANKLSKVLKLPVYRIGTYRAKYLQSDIGEADAWVSLFKDLSRRKWKNSILETTGLNGRESFLRNAFHFTQIVTIKLEAPRKILYQRIKKKKKSEQGGDWLFSVSYQDKQEFVRKLFKEFVKIPTQIRIDTNKHGIMEVFKFVREKLEKYLDLYEIIERSAQDE